MIPPAGTPQPTERGMSPCAGIGSVDLHSTTPLPHRSLSHCLSARRRPMHCRRLATSGKFHILLRLRILRPGVASDRAIDDEARFLGAANQNLFLATLQNTDRNRHLTEPVPTNELVIEFFDVSENVRVSVPRRHVRIQSLAPSAPRLVNRRRFYNCNSFQPCGICA